MEGKLNPYVDKKDFFGKSPLDYLHIESAIEITKEEHNRLPRMVEDQYAKFKQDGRFYINVDFWNMFIGKILK